MQVLLFSPVYTTLTISLAAVPDLVRQAKELMAQRPDLLHPSPSVLESLGTTSRRMDPQNSPTSSSGSQFSTLSSLSAISQVTQDTSTSIASTCAVAPTYAVASTYAVSPYERDTYYHGIAPGDDHPELLYRTGAEKYPWIPPAPSGRFDSIPTKSVRGVYETLLNKVWPTVGPKIFDCVGKAIPGEYSIDPARFITSGEEEKETLGPVVVWVTVPPRSTSADTAHDVSKSILALLSENGVDDVEVEWCEGTVSRLASPALLPVVKGHKATVNLRHHFTPVIGAPVSAEEMEADDALGTLGFYFHENKDCNGDPSDKVYGVTNHHVLLKNDDEEYTFKNSSSPRRYVRISGSRQFKQDVEAIEAQAKHHFSEAIKLTGEIQELEAMGVIEDVEEAKAIAEELCEIRVLLEQHQKALEEVETLRRDLLRDWGTEDQRNIGYVHHSPPISIDDQGQRYTEDWGTVQLYEDVFKPEFQGNVVDFGTKIPSEDLNEMICTNNGDIKFKYPKGRLFRINGVVTPEVLAKPNREKSTVPSFVILKDGCATGLTVGYYAGIESYRRSQSGVESMELAIYNYSPSIQFSKGGDSGSLIFDTAGRMMGLLHAGKAKERTTSTYVTYATPIWWLIPRIKKRYPYADFNRTKW